MRNKTQERIEELARERGATAIDLALVEDGIEIGKQMMAEMIANYPTPGKSATAAAPVPAAPPPRRRARPRKRNGAARNVVPAGNGSGYLNEVSPLTRQVRPANIASLIGRPPRQRRRGKHDCRRTASAARTTSGFSSTR